MWLALDDMSAANGGLRVLPFGPRTAGEVKYSAAPRQGAAEQPMLQHHRVDTTDPNNPVNLPNDISGPSHLK